MSQFFPIPSPLRQGAAASTSSTTAFSICILLLLTLLPLLLAAFAFVLQWRGGLTDPTSSWPTDRQSFPGIDNNPLGSSRSFFGTVSTHTSSNSDCSEILSRGSSSSFPFFRGWNFDLESDISPKAGMSFSIDEDFPIDLEQIILTAGYIGQQLLDDTYAKLTQEYIEMLEPEVDSSSSNQPKKKRMYIERGREEAHQKLYEDYFSDNPTYDEELFRRRFRMKRDLFLRIVDGVAGHDSFFQNKHDATGRHSLSPLQKCTAAIRMLAYGVAADSVDDYLRISESTTLKCVKRFVHSVIKVFGEEYLRRPNAENLQRLLRIGEQRVFPGMLGSIDCMHWEWKNCPVAWHGQYARGDHSRPTLMLEAVASQDLWIWHAFFGLPGTLNDINVSDRSPLFEEVLEGRAPKVNFSVNGNNYNLGYYLTDGIYPTWATFVKSITLPQTPKHQLFAKHQEAARKDVERAFGVLQARFAIISGPTRMWSKETIGEIMRACVIMHNMIVEDERHEYARNFNHTYDQGSFSVSRPEVSRVHLAEYQEYLRNHAKIRNRSTNQQLQANLVKEIWNRFEGVDAD